MTPNRIQLLPDQVANQIAAGEVVERPASVVKELVENSLDAGARRIEVEIQAGGRNLIRVTDDGLGMNRDDALLSLERHATSKITSAEDLRDVGSFGFRGEALPSIASVSRFVLTTRLRGEDETTATQVVVEGGRIQDVREAGHPHGTMIEVRQLFYNLPARRKFLRAIETERTHIQHYLMLVALAHPGVALTFIQDQRRVFQLPAVAVESRATGPLRALRARWNLLPGKEPRVIPLDHEAGALPGMESPTEETRETPRASRLWGLIGEPGISRGSRSDILFFVNRRPVENRALNRGLQEGYRTVLMKGRYPVCCLFLELEPSQLDVNVHPAKREIRFLRERPVEQFVAEAVEQTLRDFHTSRSAEKKVAPAAETVIPRPLPAVQVIRNYDQMDLSADSKADPSRPSLKPAPTDPRSAIGNPPLPPDPPPAPRTPASSPLPPSLPTSEDTEPRPLLHVPLRLVGVVGKLYAALESDQGLVLLDQRAAHERVLYERLLKRAGQGDFPSQKLLLPETLEFSPGDTRFVREHLKLLNHLGVGLSEFGDRTFLLDGLPSFVQLADARRYVLDVVDDLRESGSASGARAMNEKRVAQSICRQAVRSGKLLSGVELEQLIGDLCRCSMPYTSPFGRPTLIEMSFRELERKFGRL